MDFLLCKERIVIKYVIILNKQLTRPTRLNETYYHLYTYGTCVFSCEYILRILEEILWDMLFHIFQHRGEERGQRQGLCNVETQVGPCAIKFDEFTNLAEGLWNRLTHPQQANNTIGHL